jgi:lipoate---protein ligase
MKHCNLTLPTPEENLACDEAFLNLCEEGAEDELLRFWEPSRYFVVVGYANKAASEVNLAFCQRNTIPVLRRCTGGGTVLQGPGILNYTLILRLEGSATHHNVTATNRYVLERHHAALGALLRAPVELQGHTDLAIGGLKFCGNAQRRGRRSLIFHGSFLLHLDIDLLERVLPMPSKQPDYRLNRSHSEFLMNLRIPAELLRTTLQKAWNATEPLSEIPFDRMTRLARDKYATREWNFKF